MLNWVNRFNIFCLLDNRHYDFSKPAFECLLAAVSKENIEMQSGSAFDALRHFYAANKNEWLFGHFGYDLKNEIENLISSKPDHLYFPDIFYIKGRIAFHCNHICQQAFFNAANFFCIAKYIRINGGG